ncbi:MAG TPA: SsgA family sporulation/cell division regulator [Streptosporangiaceae bacterium]
MNSGETTVSTELDFALIGPEDMRVPLIASMFYSRNDPYAVRIAFHTGTDSPIEWVFARDLLAGGLLAREGIGDIRLWPSSGAVGEAADEPDDTDEPEAEIAAEYSILNIEMSSPAGHAHVLAPAPAVAGFLQRTYRIAPAGSETTATDIDAELHALLR